MVRNVFQSMLVLGFIEALVLPGKGLARRLSRSSARFQPLPIGTAREVFPQAARPVSFIERVMYPVAWPRLSRNPWLPARAG